MTPFEILEVAPGSTDWEVKEAYLRKVRMYPPEANPDRFRMISDAFSRIASENLRLDCALFSLRSPLRSPLDVLSKQFLFGERKPMAAEDFKRFFRRGSGYKEI